MTQDNRRVLQNDRFLKVLRGEAVDRTPVWLMRQAGRYLPEYREVRAQAGNFMNLCMNPELACEVTMQPLRRYGFDAAILFSDILTIPDAMGLELRFAAGEGPVFDRPVQDAAAIKALKVPDVHSDLGYVIAAVEHIRAALGDSLPLIGFSGSPWTLAAYMVEGQGSKDFAKPRAMLHEDPTSGQMLIDKLTESVSEYLKAQIRAGADAAMIFDTWGGLLTSEQYLKYSLGSMQKIVDALKADPDTADTPVILFSKGCARHINAMADTGCAGLGLDWTVELGDIARQVGNRVALQGNLDPAILNAAPEVVRAEVQRIFASRPNDCRHIFNLGHGITPGVTPEAVGAAVEAVHEFGTYS
ncbi:MAG: uroporphyrinogen decarboxylase [Xanthomonadales bacterium]|jgi:uroporphyrinogen decarboxylase|nr:uroporphyrinogen decarboxylase [Xanthomonadales bacterium]